jgi:Arc/MetJ-type ribon-helix-helix transcriptional regulator
VKRFTNKEAHWRGNTVVMAVRIPRPIADAIDEVVGAEGFPNRSAVLQHAIALWAIMQERDAGE